MADIAVALKGMGGQDEGISDALASLLELDGEEFDESYLAMLGLALADKPRLASVYQSFTDRQHLRRKFLRKVLDTEV
ncbi:hypothetical protein CF327_g5212 [Tilletia walkeri]|nr:hypothetical protein CF327_g5212 [Tilletia walkeri]